MINRATKQIFTVIITVPLVPLALEMTLTMEKVSDNMITNGNFQMPSLLFSSIMESNADD